MRTYDKKGLSAGFKRLEKERREIEEQKSVLQKSLYAAERQKKEFIVQRDASSDAREENERLNAELSKQVDSVKTKRAELERLIVERGTEINKLRDENVNVEIELSLLTEAEDNFNTKSKGLAETNLENKRLQTRLDNLVADQQKKTDSATALLKDLEQQKIEYEKKSDEAKAIIIRNESITKSLEQEQKRIDGTWSRINKAIRDRRLEKEIKEKL